MKAILVIDMPNRCCECPYFYNDTCTLTRKELGIFSSRIGRNIDFCPLKSMPQKKKLEESGNSLIDDCKEYYTDGWNECIDEILGEAE